MNVAKPFKLYTLDEFEQMTKEEHITYELIDGIVMMSPRPAAKHQLTCGNLYAELRTTLRQKNYNIIFEFDLLLEHNYLVPDLMIACEDKFEGNRYEKVPQIIVEIISPSSASRDYLVKRNKYEQLGIPEYWIVSPEEQCIDVLCFTDASHTNYCVKDNPILTSCSIPELTIDLNNVFE